MATRVAIVRLNYAIDLRYGVLVDIALRVHGDDAVPLTMGYVNVIWQGDANRIVLECLPHAASQAFVVNVTGREVLSVRSIAEWFAARFGKTARFAGSESADALLSNTDRIHTLFAPPEVSLAQMQGWVADWVERGGPVLGKPTRFEARDGRF